MYLDFGRRVYAGYINGGVTGLPFIARFVGPGDINKGLVQVEKKEDHGLSLLVLDLSIGL